MQIMAGPETGGFCYFMYPYNYQLPGLYVTVGLTVFLCWCLETAV